MPTVQMDTKITTTSKRHFLRLLQVFPKDFVLISKPRFDVNKRTAEKRSLLVRTVALRKTRMSAILKQLMEVLLFFLKKYILLIVIRLTYYYEGFF